MASVKKIGIVLGALAVVVTAGGYLLPQRTIVERSIEIQAPVQTIFHLVGTLPENEKWSPWKAEDPTYKTTYSKQTDGVGATMSFDGETVKTGSMTITDIKDNELIVMSLDFGKNGKAEASWAFEPIESGVKVTWKFEADNGANPFKRYAAALIVKGMLAKAYDQGLENLKRVSEEIALQTEPPLTESAIVQVPQATATN